jgi:hypothetical protein
MSCEIGKCDKTHGVHCGCHIIVTVSYKFGTSVYYGWICIYCKKKCKLPVAIPSIN